MKNYLLCYDISDKKRLAKLAKLLEKEAFRIQNSIFLLLEPTSHEVDILVQKIEQCIDKAHDDVRLYTIKSNGFHLGSATNLDEPFLLI
ncbi:CRISPR-associated endonuclease Cas2 [Sulfurospirillum diekertiae]|jgi:CRISPR-associated protein Cas2|uniref:CRISPR-associated endonuclease Cas2 n=1 Tax=Sulfurospirillum diekertiae TaxID=1854492 RepID=UPI0014278101|nr:CRISPR-associated endonuclease Cas2 [Sulfurospirillum diekertiae]QIR77889.1 CRISPR-associated endonuclease Cas2 [Sulfurospirillum diekertiae]